MASGYALVMKFTIGFVSGLVVGAYLFDNMTADQRARVGAATSSAVDRVRRNKVAVSVSDNVGSVADAASERIADAVDTTGDKLVDVVASNGS